MTQIRGVAEQAKARRLREGATLVLDDGVDRRGGFVHVEQHVGRVLDRMNPSEGEHVLSEIQELADSTQMLGPGGAAELYTKLAHFLSLDGAVMEGNAPWPRGQRRRRSR